jgi:hypothetical protein
MLAPGTRPAALPSEALRSAVRIGQGLTPLARLAHATQERQAQGHPLAEVRRRVQDLAGALEQVQRPPRPTRLEPPLHGLAQAIRIVQARDLGRCSNRLRVLPREQFPGLGALPTQPRQSRAPEIRIRRAPVGGQQSRQHRFRTIAQTGRSRHLAALPCLGREHGPSAAFQRSVGRGPDPARVRGRTASLGVVPGGVAQDAQGFTQAPVTQVRERLLRVAFAARLSGPLAAAPSAPRRTPRRAPRAPQAKQRRPPSTCPGAPGVGP